MARSTRRTSCSETSSPGPAKATPTLAVIVNGNSDPESWNGSRKASRDAGHQVLEDPLHRGVDHQGGSEVAQHTRQLALSDHAHAPVVAKVPRTWSGRALPLWEHLYRTRQAGHRAHNLR